MPKIKCPNCGKELDSDSNFCIYCGSEVKKSNGLLSRLKNIFILDKTPEQTYDYFVSIEDDIKQFNENFIKDDYISSETAKKLKTDNETNFRVCLKLKKHLDNSEINLTSKEHHLLDLYIANYENFDENIKRINRKSIDRLFDDLKDNEKVYSDFIDIFDTNISYEKLITEDIKDNYEIYYDVAKKLLISEKLDGYDLGSKKDLIHKFSALYENFDNIKTNINLEVEKRNEIQQKYVEIKPHILEFIKKYKTDSVDVYIDDYQSILNEYESDYTICNRLNDIFDDEPDSMLIDFLSIYDNFEDIAHDMNISYIDKIYSEFLDVKIDIKQFIHDYKTNPSYDKLLSKDLKEDFRSEFNICKDLIRFEKTDNYDLKENKKLIYEFNDLYYDFDKQIDKINAEVSRRENIRITFERNQSEISKFINAYTNPSSDLYIENYESILDIYQSEYNSCLNLSKLPIEYHNEKMSQFLEAYENFENIAQNINENYLHRNFEFYQKNKSEITNIIAKYKNLIVDEYLANKNQFLKKYYNLHECTNILIKYEYQFSDIDLSIINEFNLIFDNFNGEFPSKIYQLFLKYFPSLDTFISKYDGSFDCVEYIFNKNDILDDFVFAYNLMQDVIKLKKADELNLNDSENNTMEKFIYLFEHFDDIIKNNNTCYVNNLNKQFIKQKQSILDFISTYDVDKTLDYYISDEHKVKTINSMKTNYELCSDIINIPEIENKNAEKFIGIYSDFDSIVFEMNKNYVKNLYDINYDKINEYVSLINLTQNFYVSNQKLNELLQNHSHYFKIVLSLLDYCAEYDYLEDKSKLNKFPINSDELVQITPDANETYIKRELVDNKEFFDTVVNGKPLDENQRKAVIIDEDNTQIIAGAGCGKTLTLQAKAKYLIDKKGVSPEEILAISYSKLAQKDLDKKMNEIGVDIDVSTFHSLGLNTLRKNNVKANVYEYGLTEAIKKYFLDKVLEDVEKIQKIIEYFGYYMYEPLDKQNVENIGEVYDYERGMDLETLYSKFQKLKDPTLKKTTLRGEKVKSLEERRIANFLFINGVKYSYEKNYEAKIDWQKTYDYLGKIIFKDLNMPETIKNNQLYDLLDYLELDEFLEWPKGGVVEKYHPDFYLDEYDIYYEHFGVNRKCLAPWLPRKQSREYKKEMRNKRFLHKKYGTKLIETYSYYQSENRLLDRLKEKLMECGVEFHEINYQQFMLDLLHDEEKINEYWDFIKLVKTFISLFKGNGYKKEKFTEFKNQNDSLDDGFLKEKHGLFLEIVEDIYDYYEEYLKKKNAIDFNDMINCATEILQDNDFYKNYRYILVDEFQDTSHTRFNFLKTLKEKLNSKLIVVGDDWQSIYRFTGCDIDLFTNFKDYFENSKTEICYITNTYRNSQSLIDISGNFIMKNESQFEKHLNSKSDVQIDDTIKLYQYLNFLEQPFVFEIMINDIYNSSTKENEEILVLGRNRKDYKVLINEELFYTSGSIDDKNLKIHYRKNPRVSIRYMTVHGSKGLEEDNVILVNLEDKKNGFPNKIEDDSVLSFVKNEKEENIEFAEERRLFYVALTRTKQRTYLLAPKDKKSLFLNEILDNVEVVDFELSEDYEVYGDEIRTIASTGGVCPYCGTGKINLLFNPKSGKKFFKCSNSPKCDWFGGNYYESVEELNNPKYCPKCGGLLVKKTGDFPTFYGCINYFPDKACRYREYTNE